MTVDNSDSLSGLPVAVGGSFSGLLLSLQLSTEGIEHVLIGGE